MTILMITTGRVRIKPYCNTCKTGGCRVGNTEKL